MDKLLVIKLSEIEDILPALFIPAIYDSNKHMPTDEQVKKQVEDIRLYKIKLREAGQNLKHFADYDFRIGWQYGFGQGVSEYRQKALADLKSKARAVERKEIEKILKENERSIYQAQAIMDYLKGGKR